MAAAGEAQEQTGDEGSERGHQASTGFCLFDPKRRFVVVALPARRPRHLDRPSSRGDAIECDGLMAVGIDGDIAETIGPRLARRRDLAARAALFPESSPRMVASARATPPPCPGRVFSTACTLVLVHPSA